MENKIDENKKLFENPEVLTDYKQVAKIQKEQDELELKLLAYYEQLENLEKMVKS